MKKLFLFIASSQVISAALAFAGQPISPSDVRGLVENSIPPLETNFKIGETWECTTFSWDKFWKDPKILALLFKKSVSL